MPRSCVINVTQLKSVDKASLMDKIGTLSKQKMEDVSQGLKLVLDLA